MHTDRFQHRTFREKSPLPAHRAKHLCSSGFICGFKRLVGSLFLAVIFLLLGTLAAQASTIGYWRFDQPDPLADSGPHALALTQSGTAVAFTNLGDTGAGSRFQRTISRTGLPNDGAVVGTGADGSFGPSLFTRVDTAAFSALSTRGLTIEAYLNFGAGSNGPKVIAAQGGGQTNGAWSFGVSGNDSGLGARRLFFQFRTVSGSWASSLFTLNSGVEITPGADYYVAFTIDLTDTTASGAVFRIQNLSAGTPLETIGVARAAEATALFDTTLAFTIGSNGAANPWVGTLDEIRLSATPLSADRLLTGTRVVPPPEPEHWIGINVSAAEFTNPATAATSVPGVEGTHYFYPTAAAMNYYQSKGIRLIRFPFRWERIQLTPGGPLRASEMKRMDDVMRLAAERGMRVILDMHNFSDYFLGGVRYKIGMPGSPITAEHFRDVWRRIVQHYQAIPELAEIVYAYDIMNEPTYYANDPTTPTLWPSLAQSVVDTIRATDPHCWIMISGDAYSQATNWELFNEGLLIHDPSDRIIYQAHTYFDKSRAGTYALGGYDAEEAYPEVALDRVRPFIDWVQKKNVRGFVGEYGVPRNDPRWLPVLQNLLAYLADNGVGGAYWCTGPNTVNNPLTAEPLNGVDRPQMPLIAAHHDGLGGVGIGTGLQAFYHRHTDLSGDVVTQPEPALSLALGGAAPAGTDFGSTWSARWIGKLKAPATGEHVFHALATGGIRVWVNGRLIIDRWQASATPVENSGALKLYRGNKYDLRVEFFNTGTGTVQLEWTLPDGARATIPTTQFYPDGDGLFATYHADEALSAPVGYRLESQVFKPWYGRAPLPGMGPRSFSVRWEGYLRAPAAGTYKFTTLTDDGVRIWFNGEQVADDWRVTDKQLENTFTATLTAGTFYPVVIEYFHQSRTIDSSRAFFFHQPVVEEETTQPFAYVPEEWLFSAKLGPSPAVDLGWTIDCDLSSGVCMNHGEPTVETAGDGTLFFRFVRAHAELDYTVLVSSDLTTWTVQATNPGATGSTVFVPLPALTTEDPRRFARLRVTRR